MSTAFDVEGNWYKGVTHFHSTGSDGRWSPGEMMDWYRSHGYHFAVLTDHLACTTTDHLSVPDFLTIPGIELHGDDPQIERTPHIVGLGRGFEGQVFEGDSLQGMIDRIAQRGMIAIVAHPYWSALTDAHLAPLQSYVGVEIYNHTCECYSGKGDSLTHWDALLYEGTAIWGFAVDDAHCQLNDIGGAWIVVKAPALTEPHILEAIRQGHFYASQGPAIEDWTIQDATIHVRSSPVRQIQIQAPNGRGRVVHASEEEMIAEAEITLPELPPYLRVTCIDAYGKRAWTNPVFPYQV
jgi:hypothetical protein